MFSYRKNEFQLSNDNTQSAASGNQSMASAMSNSIYQAGISMGNSFAAQMLVDRDQDGCDHGHDHDKGGGDTTQNDSQLWTRIQGLAGEGKHNEAIQLIITTYNMSTADLESIGYDASLTRANATTSGPIPGKSIVKIGPLTFNRSLAALVHTIRHELEHVRQRAAGMTNQSLREFQGEAVEIISKNMPEEDVGGLISDAKRCLKYWKRLGAEEQKSNWETFEDNIH